MPFSELGLSDPILQAVTEGGYKSPTAIQTQAIPAILSGRDLLAAAATGTGKTASFVLPILERLKDKGSVRAKRIHALILVPTRELAVQVADSITLYSQYLSLTSLAIYGGVDSEPQKQRLIEGVDILVATPGRLLDLLHQRAMHFDALETLVLDEADRMLDMGFIADINKIIERLPPQRQNLLFSATLSSDIRDLAKTSVHNPLEIAITADVNAVPAINQWLITVDKDQKSALLSHLIQQHQWQQALIFIETKHGAAKLASQLEKRGIKAEAIHSGRSQAVRTQLLADFKSGDLGFLIATGIAARGIDINELPLVVNYDLPFEPDDYIHRIGRTGRAGSTGEAISLLSKDDFKNLCAIESRLGHLISRKEVEGFVPKKAVPVSVLNYVPKDKPRKPAEAKTKTATNEQKQKQTKTQTKPTRKPSTKSTNTSQASSNSPAGGKPNPWLKPWTK
ncbi:DEAD/DEAH box helicase [Pseudomaricurvus sp.]|uniref:DEAD/DEAH box helicase n=1 Tax=Pseudomaricurvus sp. TaxID=2004510 RepID=UPI003F6CF606